MLLVGVAYKPNVRDARESPSREIADRLTKLGAVVSVFDPHVADWSAGFAERTDDLALAADKADVCVLLQMHSSLDVDLLSERARRVFDARGHLTGPTVERL